MKFFEKSAFAVENHFPSFRVAEKYYFEKNRWKDIEFQTGKKK